MKAYNQTKSILTSGQALVHHQAPRPTPLNYPTLLRQPPSCPFVMASCKSLISEAWLFCSSPELVEEIDEELEISLLDSVGSSLQSHFAQRITSAKISKLKFLNFPIIKRFRGE